MKKAAITMAIVVTMLMGAHQVSAEMVDIGTGQMPAAEFNALKTMVSGKARIAENRIATPLVSTENYGMLEMTQADYAALRDMVAGRIASKRWASPHRAVEMVNIGTGEMPRQEFVALKRMVQGRDPVAIEGFAANLR